MTCISDTLKLKHNKIEAKEKPPRGGFCSSQLRTKEQIRPWPLQKPGERTLVPYAGARNPQTSPISRPLSTHGLQEHWGWASGSRGRFHDQ